MALYVERAATVDPARTVTLLHGFTQNSRCWAPFDRYLVDALGPSWGLEVVDLPGHGRSEHDDADLDTAAELCLEATVGQFWVGYSLGGRVALHMALAAPDRCRALVLVGAHPGIDDAAEREARRQLDAERAARLEAIGTQTFVDDWLTLPLFAGLDRTTDHRQTRYENRAAGLAASLRHCSTGAQRSLWEELNALVMPVLYIAGADDPKFIQIGTRFSVCNNSNRSFATIAGAGHSCHLEQPEATAATIADFLRLHDD